MKLRLKNFRSYKDTYLEFSPGISIITGENDSGKSNLLRAINWAVNNRPSGEDYRSNWGGETSVLLDTGNGVVGRHRTNSENSYTLTHTDGKKDVFKSFGTGVPDIIRQHLNIKPVNIAFQLEGPFLLGLSASDVAKYFNNIVNLDVIDTTISNIASTLRKERTALKVEAERKENLAKKLKEYDWLDEAEAKLIELEQLQRAVTGLKTGWSTLYALAKDFKRLTGAILTLDEITKHDGTAKELLQQDQAIELLTDEFSKLQELITDFKALLKANEELNEIAKHEEAVNYLLFQAEDIKLLKTDSASLNIKITDFKRLTSEENECQKITKHTGEVDKLTELSCRINSDTGKYNALYDLVERYDRLGEQLADTKDNLTDLEFEFKELMPEICPLCERPVHD